MYELEEEEPLGRRHRTVPALLIEDYTSLLGCIPTMDRRNSQAMGKKAVLVVDWTAAPRQVHCCWHYFGYLTLDFEPNCYQTSACC